jgi:hypothetical protein
VDSARNSVDSVRGLLEQLVEVRERRMGRRVSFNEDHPGAISAEEMDAVLIEVLEARLALARHLAEAK